MQPYEKAVADDKNVFLAALLSAFGYIALLAMCMYVARNAFGLTYFSPQFVHVLLGFEVVMGLYSLAMARRLFGDWRCGLKPVNWRELVWLLPYVAMLVTFAAVLLRSEQASLSLTSLATVAAMIALGFSEELMFRGILLQAGRRWLGPGKAVLLSALLFTIMHVANLLVALPPIGLLPQLSYVLFFGIAMGCIALRANSFLPLIAFHTLWDSVQFLGRLWSADFGMLYIPAIALNATMAAVLWISLRPQRKAGRPA